MPDEAGEPAVHRIRRDGGGAQPERLGEEGQARLLVEAAQQEHVGGRRVAQQRARGLHEGVHECGGLVRLGREGPDGQGRDAELLRIRLGEPAGEVAAAEDEDEAVLLHRLDEELDAVEADRAQPLARGGRRPRC